METDLLCETLQGVDIYLLDQFMKGRFEQRCKILDVGCGHGRNLRLFLQCGLSVFGIDGSADAIRGVQQLAAQLAPTLPPDHFQIADAKSLPFESQSFDAVLGIAVLHFATSEQEFAAMLQEMWRVLNPNGLLFLRLASSIGIENRIEPIRPPVYRLPDGSERYLVDEATLVGWTQDLRGRLLDPIKTTNVQGQRCMTTWVMEKRR